MPWIDAFEPVEAMFKDDVMAETWGHLAPKKNKTYKGRIVFAVGCFGSDDLNPTAISCEFEDLDSSPWFFDSMARFLSDQKTKAGFVYEFIGTFRNYEFKGRIKVLLDSNSKEA